MFKSQTIASIINSGKSQNIGGLGENLVLNAIRNMGLSAYYVGHCGASGDIRLTQSQLRIEVKTSNQNKKGEYKFCLHKNDKYGYTSINDSDIVVLQCISKSRLISYYIIPVRELTSKHITLGKNSRKYAKYQTTLSSIKSYIQ